MAKEKTPEQFKNSAKHVKYIDLARNPDNYKSKEVTFTGKVIQTLESGHTVALRVNVSKGKYGIWQDTIFVNYRRSEGEGRLLENDIVTLWGTVEGLKTYKTILRSDVTIPEINAKYITINGNEK
ncbi:hypothetical protein ACIFOE_07870 [Paenibacillus sp. NRS-1783]|uniref:hypothetical protein n=1 Tax=Paenibacillus sp. NRS-1783 TaxID=3233907 RepID=UPI003D29A314